MHGGRAPDPGRLVHVRLGVDDLEAARRFHAAVAPSCGLRAERATATEARFVGERGWILLVADGTPTRGLHVAFGGPDHATVDAFHRVGLAAGGRDEGAPGPRPEHHAGYYGAFVLDPGGTNVEAVDQR